MKTIDEIRKNIRLKINQEGWDGGNGWIHHPLFKKPMAVVFSWGGGWDHVSVSFRNRTPTWDEMCMVKDIFLRKQTMSPNAPNVVAKKSTWFHR